ncbi:uncharacterized protein DSM5745_06850 [Aspergillus mulundensis]|uniref:Uncharacterized protein n=1 Tax=Aspergillus mulundensis TaxID=1810919 RepID=A0A3D8RSB3_9EURO|nr:Uncharacterized protein DSM5745_06850 [Aspergillus mulundensis]RDW76858.1 Uncharacterized protein DSM5745_06850 [Aspergillus mulundensis]
MIASPSRHPHWPGGVPPEIQVDANGDITQNEAIEESRAWFLFVEEQWVPRTTANISDEDGDYEVRQRRQIMVEWAKASQELRDAYHQRALQRTGFNLPPEDATQNADYPGDCPDFLCLAPLGPDHRSNRSKWIKLFLLSCRLDGEMGHCLDQYGSEHGGLTLNPASHPDPSAVQVTDVLPRALLETANWNCITMTRRGTVLFLQRLGPWFLVTPDDLETGHITIVEFKRNGQVAKSLRRRACNMWPVYLKYCGQYLSLEEIEDNRVGGNAAMNSDLDMTLPIVDILEGAKARGEFLFGFDGDREAWTEDIEIYAPGYLAMEAAGNEADYDHARLIDPMEAYDIRREMYASFDCKDPGSRT